MISITLKKLSGEDKSAKIGKILVKEGDTIKAGDCLFNAESAKGNFQVKSEYDGSIQKVLIEEGSQIKIGDVIAEIEGQLVCSQPENKVGLKVSNQIGNKAGGYSFGISKPKKENVCCDIAIIGGGPGGYVAAIRAAQLGATVTLIEKEKIGGTCLNWGCIPTKSFVKSAHLVDEIKRSGDFGVHAELNHIDMEQIVKRKNSVVTNLTDGISYLLGHHKVRVITGEAVITDEGIQVKNSKIEATISAENIIIATGASPVRLNIKGSDLPAVVTSLEILDIKKIPDAITIIGGGVIGMEFAFIFSSFGSKVTVVEFLEDILFNFDQDIIEVIVQECNARGITLITKAKVEEIAMTEGGEALTAFSKEGESHYVVSDLVLMGVGRRPNLEAIDLEKLGVELNEKKNGIKVDSRMKTSKDNIYAIGDITNKIQLAHVASHQGIIAAENCMGLKSEMDYSAIPSAVFLSPEIGTVGMCEKEAIKQGIEYKISKFPFAANGKALSQGDSKGFVKIITSEKENVILGAAVVGPGATDLIANFAYYITEKVDVKSIKHLIVAHPTTAEALQEAILGIDGEAIHFA